MPQRYDFSDPPGGSGHGFGDQAGDGESSYVWISEWLCEYVDGTMDPSMQAVFEEYMEANPELEAHVERLCRTRRLLGECGCQDAADRIKEQLLDEPLPAPPPSETAFPGVTAQSSTARGDEDEAADEHAPVTVPVSAGAVVAVASAMTLMLGVGVATGAFLFAGPGAEPPATPAATAQLEQTDRRAADRAPAPSRAAQSPSAPAAQARPPRWTAPPPSRYDLPAVAGDTAASPAAALRPLVQQAGLEPPVGQ